MTVDEAKLMVELRKKMLHTAKVMVEYLIRQEIKAKLELMHAEISLEKAEEDYANTSRSNEGQERQQ